MTFTLVWGSPAAGAVLVQPVGSNELVSLQADDTAPERLASLGSAISSNGRYVAFASRARNLVDGAGREHGAFHVYLRDRSEETTTAIDLRPNSRFGNGSVNFDSLSISADARFVAFISSSTNLVHGYGKYGDVFVRDVETGTTEIVSVAADGGRADARSSDATISADGSTVIFTSYARNLLPDHSGTDQAYIYRRDLRAGTTSLVSRTPTGAFPEKSSYTSSVSADGAFVAYDTEADDIAPGGSRHSVDIVHYNVATQQSTLVSRPSSGGGRSNGQNDAPCISADGTTIVFSSSSSNFVSDDTNGQYDLYSVDVASGALALVTHSKTGGPANNGSFEPVVDSTGYLVAFTSYATDLVTATDLNDNSDVFIVDLRTGKNTLVSRTPDGRAAKYGGSLPAIAGDGSVTAYTSGADDIVAGTRETVDRVYAFRVS